MKCFDCLNYIIVSFCSFSLFSIAFLALWALLASDRLRISFWLVAPARARTHCDLYWVHLPQNYTLSGSLRLLSLPACFAPASPSLSPLRVNLSILYRALWATSSIPEFLAALHHLRHLHHRAVLRVLQFIFQLGISFHFVFQYATILLQFSSLDRCFFLLNIYVLPFVIWFSRDIGARCRGRRVCCQCGAGDVLGVLFLGPFLCLFAQNSLFWHRVRFVCFVR